MKSFVSALAGACLLAGCNGIELNEGSVRASFANPVAGASPISLDGSIFATGVDDAISRDDYFQITLVSAYICDFRESGILTSSNFDGSNGGASHCEGGINNHDGDRREGTTRGEVAITAAFEFRGDDQGSGGADPRVIYYGDDVRETGQLLNVLNIPIYGPAKFKFAASSLHLAILELDEEESSSQAALLSKLAELGGAVASPAAGAAFGVLSDLGGALLAANQDDVEFRFQMGFDAPAARTSNFAMPRRMLREGYLVLMRKEVRSDFDHFAGLTVCPRKGYVTKKGCETGEPYMGDTWLLLKITKEDPGIDEATLVGSTLQAFRESGYLSSAAQYEAAATALDNLISTSKNSD